MSRRLLIIGCGGQGKMALECATLSGAYEDVAFVTNDTHHPSSIAGYKVFHEACMDTKRASQMFDACFIAVGNNAARMRIAELYMSAGIALATLIHPDATVSSHSEVGPGAIIMPQAVVNPSALVGKGCIINTGSIVEHDCIIGPWSHLSPGAKMGGCSELMDNTWLCMGSVVSDHIKCSHPIVLAANSVLLEPPSRSGLYVGAPAVFTKKFKL